MCATITMTASSQRPPSTSGRGARRAACPHRTHEATERRRCDSVRARQAGKIIEQTVVDVRMIVERVDTRLYLSEASAGVERAPE